MSQHGFNFRAQKAPRLGTYTSPYVSESLSRFLSARSKRSLLTHHNNTLNNQSIGPIYNILRASISAARASSAIEQ
jgi:hypothetical protein